MLTTAESFLKFAAIALALTSSYGCEFIARNQDILWDNRGGGASPEPTPQPKVKRERPPELAIQQQSSVTMEKLPSLQERKQSSVELLWEIPKETVSGYTVRYGYTREHQDFVQQVKLAELERFEDGRHGTVYRYFLQGIPAEKNIYITIQAVHDGESSPPSPIIEVKAGTSERPIQTPPTISSDPLPEIP